MASATKTTVVNFGANVRPFLAGVASATAALNRFSAAARSISGTVQGSLQKVGDGLANAASAFSPISLAAGGFLGGAVRSAVESEEAVASLSRQLDMVKTPEGLRQFYGDLAQIKDETNLSRLQLIQAAEAALKAGGSYENLATDIKLAREASIGWGIDLAETADVLARIRQNLNLDDAGLREIGDSIDYLAEKNTFAESGLLDYFQRSMNTAKAAGISRDLQLAIGSALMNANLPPEVAATFFKNLSLDGLNIDPTETQLKGMEKIGVTAEKIKESFKLKGGDETVLDLLARIEKLPDALDRKQVVKDMFGREMTDEAITAVEQIARIREEYGLLQKDAESEKLSKSFDAMSMTTGFALERLRNAFSDLGDSVGGAFTPTIRRAADIVSSFAKSIAGNEIASQRLATALAAVAGAAPALFALSVAARAASFAFGALGIAMAPFVGLTRGIQLVATALATTGRAALLARRSLFAAAAPLLRFGIAGGIAVAAGFALAKAWKPLKAIWGNLFKTVGGRNGLAYLKAGFDTLLSGNWQDSLQLFKDAWRNLWPEVSARLSRTADAMREVWRGFVDWMSGIFPSFKDFDESLGKLGDAIGNLFSAFDNFAESESGKAIGAAIKKLGEQLGDATIKAGAIIVEYLAGAINQLASAIERFDAVSAKSGSIAGLKAAFDGLPTTGKILALLFGFKALRLGFRMLMSAGRGIAAPFRLIASLFGEGGGAIKGATTTMSRLGKIFTGRGLMTAARLGGKLLVKTLARGALMAIPYVGPILVGAMTAWDIGALLYDAFRPSIYAAFAGIGNWFAKKWNDWAVTPAKNTWAAITGVIDEQLAYMRDMLRPFMTWAGDLWGTYIATPAGNAWKAVEDATFASIEWTTEKLDALGSTIQSAFDDIGESIKATWESVKESIGSVFDWITGKIDGMLESIATLKNLLPTFDGAVPVQPQNGGKLTPANDNATAKPTSWFDFGRPPTEMPVNREQWKPLEALGRVLDRIGEAIIPGARAGEMPVVGDERVDTRRSALAPLPDNFAEEVAKLQAVMAGMTAGAMRARMDLRSTGAAIPSAGSETSSPNLSGEATIGELRGIRGSVDRTAASNENMIMELGAVLGELRVANGTLTSINGHAGNLPGAISSAIRGSMPWQGQSGGSRAPGAVPRASLDSPSSSNGRAGP